MKKIKIIILLNCITLNVFTQTDCDHNVSTKYNAPTNNSLPNNNPQFLNSFDWNASSNGILLPYQLQNMQYNQNMVNIMSDQMPQYYSYIYNGEKLTYQNGWELLLLNIGKFPNGDPNNLFQDLPDVPYIVLYNRYKGIIRVFANYGAGYLSNGISISKLFC